MDKDKKFIPIDRFYNNFEGINDDIKIPYKVGFQIKDANFEECDFSRVGYGQVTIKGVLEKELRFFVYLDKEGNDIKIPFEEPLKNIYKLEEFKALGMYNDINPVFTISTKYERKVVDVGDPPRLGGFYSSFLIGFLVGEKISLD